MNYIYKKILNVAITSYDTIALYCRQCYFKKRETEIKSNSDNGNVVSALMK